MNYTLTINFNENGQFNFILLDKDLIKDSLIGQRERRLFSIVDSPPAVASVAVVGLKALKALSAGIGKYALTGRTVTFRKGKVLTALLGTYLLTPTITNLKKNYVLSASIGTISLSATSIFLIHSVSSDLGTYSLTSPDVGLIYDRTLEVNQQDLILTGQNLDLIVAFVLDVASGSITLISSLNLYAAYILESDSGIFVQENVDVELRINYAIQTEIGSFALIALNSNLYHHYLLEPDFGTFIQDTPDVNLYLGLVILADETSIQLSGQDIVFDIPNVASSGSFILSSSLSTNLIRTRNFDVIQALYDLIAIDITFISGGTRAFILIVDNGFYSLIAIDVDLEIIMNPYISIDEADDYFDTRLNSSRWENISESKKLKALISSSRIMNRLKFKGAKVDPDQELEFPRTIYDEDGILITEQSGFIPENIKFACAELAYALLSGKDPEEEINNLSAESRSYAATRVQYNAFFVHEHIRAGVPSAIAWDYLKPYLATPLDQVFVRIN